jgi:hypothetical protein
MSTSVDRNGEFGDPSQLHPPTFQEQNATPFLTELFP